MLEAIVTATTCGEACWSAREDVCRCSCGGANHGCLRTADGVAPVRTSKINGEMHRLMAVGTQGEMHTAACGINKAAMGPRYWHGADTSRDFGIGPAKVRKATDSQVEKWPELAGQRGWKEQHAGYDQWRFAPYLLWLKEDVYAAAQA